MKTDKPSKTKEGAAADRTRKAQILRVAIETIASLGYAQASVGQIAARAGISKGVITYHFASKDEIMEQIVKEVYEAAVRFMQPIIERETAPAAVLRAYIESNLAFMAANRDHIVALTEIVGNARGPDGRPKFADSSDDSILQPVVEILRWGEETGEFKAFSDFSARVAAVTLRSAIDGVAYRLVADPGLDVAGFARELAELFLAAVRRPARETETESKERG